MSLYFDLVINCYLREDISEDHVKAIRCLTSVDFELNTIPQLIFPGEGNIWNIFSDHHFLAPNPERQIISHFQQIHVYTIPTENDREVRYWLLQYAGRWIHDDYFIQHHAPFIHWLPSVARDGLIGYQTETDYEQAEIRLLFAQHGKLIKVSQSRPDQT